MNHGAAGHAAPAPSLNRLAAVATTHCLTGCAIGEVLGLVIATALGWHDVASIALAVVLAYAFGYALTLRPLLRSGMAIRAAAGIAFAADSVSITVMEIVDNAVILAVRAPWTRASIACSPGAASRSDLDWRGSSRSP